jgi:hypothetical protein
MAAILLPAIAFWIGRPLAVAARAYAAPAASAWTRRDAFRRGEANGDILVDFAGNGAAAGDTFQFEGYGTAGAGATFTPLDATHWRINSSDGAVHDTITLLNGASVHASDVLFI